MQISTSAEEDRASNFFTAPVPLAASGGSENTGPEEPLQLAQERQPLALAPPLVTERADERTSPAEMTPEAESSILDDEVSALDITPS